MLCMLCIQCFPALKEALQKLAEVTCTGHRAALWNPRTPRDCSCSLTHCTSLMLVEQLGCGLHLVWVSELCGDHSGTVLANCEGLLFPDSIFSSRP